MKKTVISAVLLAVLLALSSCGGGKIEPPTGGTAPAGAADDAATGKALSYKVMEDGKIAVYVKTSAELKKTGWLGLCPVGSYPDENAADEADQYYVYWDQTYDKEWCDGVYTFLLNTAEIGAGNYSMVLCDDDDGGKVIGTWLCTMTGTGKLSFDFRDAWLIGAGEGRNPGEFKSAAEEIAAWFAFDWGDDRLNVYYDGPYLESADGALTAYLCPEGRYASGEAADAADVTSCPAYEKCPYLFTLDPNVIKNGRWTLVLCDGKGQTAAQFDLEKKGKDFSFDYSKAVSPLLDGKKY